jgi:hypothetical protein
MAQGKHSNQKRIPNYIYKRVSKRVFYSITWNNQPVGKNVEIICLFDIGHVGIGKTAQLQDTPPFRREKHGFTMCPT